MGVAFPGRHDRLQPVLLGRKRTGEGVAEGTERRVREVEIQRDAVAIGQFAVRGEFHVAAAAVGLLAGRLVAEGDEHLVVPALLSVAVEGVRLAVERELEGDDAEIADGPVVARLHVDGGGIVVDGDGRLDAVVGVRLEVVEAVEVVALVRGDGGATLLGEDAVLLGSVLAESLGVVGHGTTTSSTVFSPTMGCDEDRIRRDNPINSFIRWPVECGHGMVSKGDLGVSYLVAVGVVLFGVFSGGMLLPVEAARSRSLLGLSMGIMIAGSFLVTGIGLARSTLDDERVWRVAGWSTLGLGVPTLLAVLVIVLLPSMLRGIGWRSVVLVNIAAGGVVGVLVGSLLELRAEHERTRTLNQRNTVFLRLFRHDIRTSVNLIRGHLDLVASAGETPLESADVIRDHLTHIERLSDAANRLDDLESMTETEPIDFGALVRDRVDTIQRSTNAVTVETDIHPESYVRANGLLTSVVDNLLRNAVEHGSTSHPSPSEADPWIRVTVRPDGRGDTVVLRVEDDGPGFTDTELAVHADAETTETALRHSDGVGLWLVRWIVDAYDGEFTVENGDDGGAIVIVRLPTTSDEPATNPELESPPESVLTPRAR
ncbi:sensor histidine kinase [Haloplanus rubicundus]|uniref:histidine kinase n=2 Tax=Haloplanus rubicundus TaxID=1547898 RepID=A0A345E1G7_9EURY|nr:sensor histidine kinase [Haloplanus rubicundus]